MLDRQGLKVYISLMDKEMTAAKAALATLNANEGALYGGGGRGGDAGGAGAGVELSQPAAVGRVGTGSADFATRALMSSPTPMTNNAASNNFRRP
jgi:hypothetical protein